MIPRRHFETSRNSVAKFFWWLQWRRMERYERETCRKFSATVAVSESDKRYLAELSGTVTIFAIPTGVDTAYFAPREEPVKENSLVFTGSMDWLANEDAIRFFAREILGKIKCAIPNVQLTVVGRNPSQSLIKEPLRSPRSRLRDGWTMCAPLLVATSLRYSPSNRRRDPDQGL